MGYDWISLASWVQGMLQREQAHWQKSPQWLGSSPEKCGQYFYQGDNLMLISRKFSV
jgi:hypothetical protein